MRTTIKMSNKLDYSDYQITKKFNIKFYVKEMSFFWEVSGTSVQGNQSPRTARLTPLFPDLSGKTSTAQCIP